jgi:hypothetical protein
VREAPEYDAAYKQLKVKRKEAEKLPNYEKVDCVNVSLGPLKAALEDQQQRLSDALQLGMARQTTATQRALDTFITESLDTLSKRPQSVDEITDAKGARDKIQQDCIKHKAYFKKLEDLSRLLALYSRQPVELAPLAARWDECATPPARCRPHSAACDEIDVTRRMCYGVLPDSTRRWLSSCGWLASQARARADVLQRAHRGPDRAPAWPDGRPRQRAAAAPRKVLGALVRTQAKAPGHGAPRGDGRRHLSCEGVAVGHAKPTKPNHPAPPSPLSTLVPGAGFGRALSRAAAVHCTSSHLATTHGASHLLPVRVRRVLRGGGARQEARRRLPTL